MGEAATHLDAYTLRALRAARAIAWDYDLRTGLISHRAVSEVLGLTSLCSPVTLKRVLRFVHPQDRRDLIARMRIAVRHREPFVHHFRLVIPGMDDLVWVENHADIVFDKDGQPVLFAGALVDITAHRRAMDALEAADRRKDEFIATVAHEFRSPLAAIHAMAHLLLSSMRDPVRLKTYVRRIQRQTARLTRLVDDLLDMSHALEEGLELRQESVDLSTVINLAVESCDSLIGSRRQVLNLAMPAKPVSVRGDVERLTQVVGNLLSNAAKYTHKGGSIHVQLQQEADQAIIRVRDSGVGIASEDLPQVFEPFYRAKDARSSGAAGLGLGLALVRHIVRLHGGSVEVTSAGPGRGSEFIVRLPAAAEPGDRPAGGAPCGWGAKPARSLRILIADDDRDVAEAFAEGLRMFGHEVSVAFDGEEALRIADAFRPEVALLDLTMPSRSGREVAVELRKRPWARERSILTVAFTGWKRPDHQTSIDSNAFDAQIMKPAEIEAIHRLVLDAHRQPH